MDYWRATETCWKWSKFTGKALELKMLQKRRIAQSSKSYRNSLSKITRLSKKFCKVSKRLSTSTNKTKQKKPQQISNISNNGKLITEKN